MRKLHAVAFPASGTAKWLEVLRVLACMNATATLHGSAYTNAEEMRHKSWQHVRIERCLFANWRSFLGSAGILQCDAVGRVAWAWHAVLTTDDIVRLGVVEADHIELHGGSKDTRLSAALFFAGACLDVVLLRPSSRWNVRTVTLFMELWISSLPSPSRGDNSSSSHVGEAMYHSQHYQGH